MLVLSRKVGEKISLRGGAGEQIKLVVLEIRGHGNAAKVRLGFVAPDDCEILRQEVIERETGDAHAT